MQKVTLALKWITNLLQSHRIPYQITGGLAAHAYGATRPLEDIDIDIPEEYFPVIEQEVKQYIIFGPARFKDKHWDLLLMTLNYHDQAIDLSGAYTTNIFDTHTNQWHSLTTAFSKAEIKNVVGLQLPVIARDQLIAYKKSLARDVDLLDLAEISEQN